MESVPLITIDLAAPPERVAAYTAPQVAIDAIRAGTVDVAAIDKVGMVQSLSASQRKALQSTLLAKGKLWSVAVMLAAPKAQPTFNMVVETFGMLTERPNETYDDVAGYRDNIRLHQDGPGSVNAILRKSGPLSVFVDPETSAARYGTNPVWANTNIWMGQMECPQNIVPPVVAANADVMNGDARLHTLPKTHFPIIAAGRVAHDAPATHIATATPRGTVRRRIAGVRCPKHTRVLLKSFLHPDYRAAPNG